jgi:RNA polymerase sigma factor (sigma-70 family)
LSNKKQVKKHPVQILLGKCRQGVAPKHHDNEQEIALIQRYKEGDDEAGWSLVYNYIDTFSVILSKPTKPPIKTRAMERLFASPSAEDFEDLFQEVLVQFFILVDEYEEDKGPFVNMIRSKLHQRVFNRYFSEYLFTKMSETELEENYNLVPCEESIFIEEVQKVPAHYIELYEALNQITSKQREVIILSVVKGWSSGDIALELDSTATAIRKLKERGISQLKLIMGA